MSRHYHRGDYSYAMKNVLLLELWGIGDATLMSSILQGLAAENWAVTVLAKPQTCALLRASYPTVRMIEFDAPWTVFHGKYRLERWPWAAILRVVGQLRRGRFDAAISVRSDPRDHLLMWLAGVRRRIGFSTQWSRWLLSEPIPIRDSNAHRVEDWWKLQDALTASPTAHFSPKLIPDPGLVDEFRARLGNDPRPVIALHCGARIAVRRWPEAYYRELILFLGGRFDFQLVLLPDPDGYGGGLQDLADHTFARLTLPELLALLSCASQVVCNDSGPCHLAAALAVPVIAFFGPQRPELFRPFGEDHLVVIRDICPFRPCSDYCRFPEPYCLTQLTPDRVCPEIERHLISRQRIPLRAPGLLSHRGSGSPSTAP
jgi:ADP-heptose:LPS heptosyltransferase